MVKIKKLKIQSDPDRYFSKFSDRILDPEKRNQILFSSDPDPTLILTDCQSIDLFVLYIVCAINCPSLMKYAYLN